MRRIVGLRRKGHKHRVSVDGPIAVTLDRVNPRRAKVGYYDPDLRRWTVEEFVEAVKKGAEYSLYLRTPEVSYEKGRGVFDAVVKSFGGFGSAVTIGRFLTTPISLVHANWAVDTVPGFGSTDGQSTVRAFIGSGVWTSCNRWGPVCLKRFRYLLRSEGCVLQSAWRRHAYPRD